MIETGERLETEYRILRRDGSVAWVRDEGVLVPGQPGQPACLQGYILDITESIEREAALRRSDARTRAMLDAALDGIITIDHGGAIVEFNSAAERMFGYDREAVIGRQMVDLIVPPSLRTAHLAGFERYLATGEGHLLGKRVEVAAMRADGSEFPVELSIAAVEVPGEAVFTASLRDIGEQKQREEALLEERGDRRLPRSTRSSAARPTAS